MAFSEFRDIRIAAIVSAVPETSTSANSGVPRASAEQTASDLGYSAVRNILDHEGIDKEEVGILIFASKTPDYRSPATACVLHGRLGFSVDCVAFDVNLGSNGFTLGLQSVCSLLASSKKKYAILVAGDTTSKQTSESKLEKNPVR